MDLRHSQVLSFLIFSLLFATSFSKTQAYCNARDKRVLFQIKEALGNPYVLASWTNNLDCCDWYCLECDDTTHRVISLTIDNSDIVGPIPDAVGNLPYLQILEFHKNSNLTGQIPSTLSKLSLLRSIRLSWNSLTGSVPSYFSQLKNLEFLDLSFNQLSGTIPGELGFAPSLRGIDLSRNKLTGSIPDSLGHFAAKDIYLYLSHNQLTGSIPSSLSKPDFTYIDFSRNSLVGDASMLFKSNSSLQHVDLSRNNFSFDFSKTVFPTAFYYLDINHNMISGSIPQQLAELELQFFNVSYNRLCGQIPTGGTGRLQTRFDQYCYFHNKCLCGEPLPACK
ncbi:Leucine-rich repeat [Dillenia turbinata]|uniref:Leucine-rich repeat n=1 Tax=Dillenia turbinata TaxID=194707 RepID=A0AAN8W232_9MAGN